MKKILLVALTLSLVTLTSCGSGNGINSKIDNLEQRVSALESGTVLTSPTPAPTESKSLSTENTSGETSNLNILSFEVTSVDSTSSKTFTKHTYKITNNGDSAIEYVSIKVGYYDSDENCIDTDGRYKDVVIEPGKFVMVDSFGGDETTKANIASSKVISYEYYLVDPNANGNNRIEVNCETGKVKESFRER